MSLQSFLRRLPVLVVCGVLGLAAACGAGDSTHEPRTETNESQARGFILISIDTLRADHLGAYGYERDTSPFFDRLAEQGVLFEKAIVQLPGTLPSHMSIFTGLYPAEHGVYPPSSILSSEIETLPEVFLRHGYRTAGFTEGGYMDGRYGFARGFEQFDDSIQAQPDDIERTLERGLDFLASLGSSERFFLFLHTYAVHDPYQPPQRYEEMFWDGVPPAGAFSPTGSHLTEVNRGTRDIEPEVVRYFEALYDGGIRYTDDLLADFFQQIEALGVLDDTVVILTSDHGEEFYEHGGMVHEQIYDETLHVPLLILHPDVTEGSRVQALTRSVDLAPTFYDLAGLDESDSLSGRSLVPYLSDPDIELSEDAYAEGFTVPGRTVYRYEDGELFQFLRFSPQPDGGMYWALDRVLELDTSKAEVEFGVRSYHEPRSLQIHVDGELLQALPITPQWKSVSIDLPASPESAKRRIRLSTEECVSPLELGKSQDSRCLSFQIRNLALERTELYNVTRDPLETTDVSSRLPAIHRDLYHVLRAYRFEPRASAKDEALDQELEDRLKSLGYLE